MNEPAHLAVVPIIHHGMSLNDILVALELHDTEVMPLADEDLDLLQKLLLLKVDGIKFQLDEWASDVSRHQAYILEHAEAQRVIKNKIESLNKRVVVAMQRAGTSELEGLERKAKLKTTESLETNSDPLPEHAEQYPDLVTTKIGVTTYQWNKTPIKQAINKGFVFNYGTIVKNTKVDFPLNRKDK